MPPVSFALTNSDQSTNKDDYQPFRIDTIVKAPGGFYLGSLQSRTNVNPATSNSATRIAAVGGALLTSIDRIGATGTLTVFSDASCHFDKNFHGVGDSCSTGGTLYLAPYGSGMAQLPHSMWKYVVAHEMGHSLQKVGMGWPKTEGYPDDSNWGTAAACRCDHVTVANQAHCLQSLERFGDAHIEGFAQAIASIAFNRRGESDCTFNYYKEFLNPRTNEAEYPPVAKSCATPVRWRNTYCAALNEGTEYDWMGFFRSRYQTMSMADIFAVHRRACNGSETVQCASQALTWPSIEAAAIAKYGSVESSTTARAWKADGENYGVDRNRKL